MRQACAKGLQPSVSVNLDPFHWFDRWDEVIVLPKTSGLVILFFSQLRDVVFRPDGEEYRNHKEQLQKNLGRAPSHNQILIGIRRVIPQVSINTTPY